MFDVIGRNCQLQIPMNNRKITISSDCISSTERTCSGRGGGSCTGSDPGSGRRIIRFHR